MTAVSAEMEPNSPISRGSSEVLVDRVLVGKSMALEVAWFLPHYSCQIGGDIPNLGIEHKAYPKEPLLLPGWKYLAGKFASGKNARCDGVRGRPSCWALPRGGLLGLSRRFGACDCSSTLTKANRRGKKWRIITFTIYILLQGGDSDE